MAKFRVKELEVLTENVSRLYNKQMVDTVKQHKDFIDVQEKTNVLLKERKNHLDSIKGIDATIEEWTDELNQNLCDDNIITVKYSGYGDKELSVDAFIYRISKQIMYEAVKFADLPTVNSLQDIEDRLIDKFISS